MKSDKSVLVVDDEPLLRELMSEWLKREGYRVRTAENGVDALRMLEAEPVDAIVTDIRMPKMDGVTLLKKVMESSSHSPAVLFVSGFSDIDQRAAYDLGAQALIAKPFTDEEILSAVRRMLTPHEELWRATSPPAKCPMLQSNCTTVASAREAGRLAFGRGGFCMQTAAARAEGPVRFDLNFTDESIHLTGHGSIRWVRPSVLELGVEIACLSDDCLQQGIDLTVHSGVRSYIPCTAKAL
jgi:CheY-like chemotaxis protein